MLEMFSLNNCHKSSKHVRKIRMLRYPGMPYLLTLFALPAAICQLMPFKLKPSPPQPPQICINEMCECNVIGFECQLKEKYGLVTVEARTRPDDGDNNDAATSQLKITCVYEPMDLDVLLSKMPSFILYHTTKFHLINCVQLPMLLNQQNITYEGTVEFGEDLDAPADFFRHTERLKKLILPIKFNYLQEPIPAQLLHNLTCLKSLTLEAYTPHPIVSWPIQLFHTLFNLEALTLKLVALHATLKHLSSAHFRDLRALKQLNLDGNFMLTLPEDLFAALPELNRLSLSLNGLQQLPNKLLRRQRKLVRLNLSNNHLQALPFGLFEYTPLLWELTLSYNQLSIPTNIIENVRALNYLRRLDLEHNQFKTVWGVDGYQNVTLFTRFGSAQPQLLSQLERLLYSEEDNGDAPALNHTIISLRANQLTYFSLDWIAEAGILCPYLFDLAANSIRNIHALVRPSNLLCLHEIHLQNNPLACNCRLAWIYNTNLLVNTDHWSCASPTHLRAESLQHLQRSALCPWTPAWCPDKCACSHRTATVLVINCSNAALQSLARLPRPEQLALAESTLILEHNIFYELPSNGTFGYANVTRIYAAHNRLSIILASHLPPQLNVLDLRHNQLTRLSDSFLLNYLNESERLSELYLADNPWLCDCGAELLLHTLRAHRARIPDFVELLCTNYENLTLADVNFNEICVLPPNTLRIMLQLIVVFSFTLVLLSFVAFYYKYELEIKVWLHAHNLMCLTCCFNVDELDKGKTFDAFISYSHQDEEYVNRILLPGLEQAAPYFRICTHERNWLAGAYIAEQIIESVAQSRRTIIVLSQHFIASDWGRMEFKTAHQSAINERRTRLIIVRHGEITDMSNLDEELQAYLKMNTYLEAEDPRFWQKLRYAMPHIRGAGRKAGMLEVSDKTYVSGDALEFKEFKKGKQSQ